MTSAEITAAGRKAFAAFCEQYGFERTDTLTTLIFQYGFTAGMRHGVAEAQAALADEHDAFDQAHGG